MEALVLRLEAPLLSFGGPAADGKGTTEDFPAPSMLTGLIGNALGYRHEEHERLQALQDALVYAVRRDDQGSRTQVTDYQTIWTRTRWSSAKWNGWSSRGQVCQDKYATVERWRDYWADASYTVLVSLRDDVPGTPSLDEIEEALKWPARPLFIGRASCIPTAPIWGGRANGSSLLALLHTVSLVGHGDKPVSCMAWWPVHEDSPDLASRIVYTTEGRDWRSQIHVGRRPMRHGEVVVKGEAR